MRVRRLRMVVALDRVGHGLSDAMSGLEAAQKTPPVIGHSAAYNSNQFRVHCPVEDNLLGYQDNANKNFFFGIISYNKINMAEYLYIVVQQHQIVMFIGIVKDNIV